MKFDIQQPVFNPEGEYLEEAAERYREMLMERFEASPEGQDLVRQGGTMGWAVRQGGTMGWAVRQGGTMGWADTLMDLGMGYLEVTPATMTAEQLRMILLELFPRKVSAEPGCGQKIVTELQAFWKFLQREFGLPDASACLRALTTATARRLEREMQNPANFGLAKAFLAQGLVHGFDMATPEGIQGWTGKLTISAVIWGGPGWRLQRTQGTIRLEHVFDVG